jgi:methylthioribose-1-phosphate isomerase
MPLRWADGELLVLDQRRLPDDEVWLRCRGAAEVADCISSMAVRGAPAIGLAAAYGVALAARAGEDLATAAELLRDTRPTAVNLTWAVDQAVVADDPL